MERTTWVEVSRAALESNLRAVSGFVKVPVCAVVKANAYGHGLTGAARIFEDAGVEMLAVTRLEEARALRESNVRSPIFIMTPTPDSAEAVALGCEITVDSWDDINTLPSQARVHLKIDTGMGRLGLPPSEALRAAIEVDGKATLVAIWTHFAGVGSGPDQLSRLLQVAQQVRERGIGFRLHAANSAAVLALPQSHLDMVRVGTLLYGENLAPASTPFSLLEGFSWYSRVVSVRNLPAGSRVGYGGEWRARVPTRVGTLPVGFADGITIQPLSRSESIMEGVRVGGGIALLALRRRPSQRVVWFGEQPAPIVGRIAMQEISVSLEGLDEVGVGSIARIPARRLLVNPEIERVYI